MENKSTVELMKPYSDVINMFPDIIEPSKGVKYVIGADYDKKNNESYFCVYNKSGGYIDYVVKVFTGDSRSFDLFCEMLGRWFNTKVLTDGK